MFLEDKELSDVSKTFIDTLFGEGSGTKFQQSANFGHETLLPVMEFYNALAADTTHLSHEEHYLVGMAVLLATGRVQSARTLVKILRHLDVSPEKIREVTMRLAIWIGGLTASEVMNHVNKAMAEYAESGIESIPWLQ